MNSNIVENKKYPDITGDHFLHLLSCLDSKVLLSLVGMTCLTTVISIGFVTLTKSEMTLSREGLSVTQPKVLA